MIFCVGEILADMIGEKEDGGLKFSAYCGGAPFNVAVNAKQCGAKVGFYGRVGKDIVGAFLENFVEKCELDYFKIEKDEKRNTTLAFVTLTDGERDFSFFRNDTADFNFDIDSFDFNIINKNDFVHCGSLMLSEEKGVEFAKKLLNETKKREAKFSFDINFRKDIFGDFSSAYNVFKPFIDSADILKFSDDELFGFTDQKDIKKALEVFGGQNKLIIVTMGSKGSAFLYNGVYGEVPSEKIKPVDTTGAGDAFFGAVLAKIDGQKLSKDLIYEALKSGNEKGAKATTFKGAIKL